LFLVPYLIEVLQSFSQQTVTVAQQWSWRINKIFMANLCFCL